MSKSFVLWFTGLPSSGKTTLASYMVGKLREKGLNVEWLDGDNVRNVFPSTGFSKQERDMHIKRIGFTSSLLERNGVIVIASFISPYQDSRDFVRSLCKNFVEVFINTPLKVCEERDVNGLYKKAKEGKIKKFTGFNHPYENPLSPEVELDTTNRSVKECGDDILNYLNEKGFLSRDDKRFFFSVVEEGVLNPDYEGFRMGRIEVYDEKSDSPYADYEARICLPEEFFEEFREVFDLKESDLMPRIVWKFEEDKPIKIRKPNPDVEPPPFDVVTEDLG